MTDYKEANPWVVSLEDYLIKSGACKAAALAYAADASMFAYSGVNVNDTNKGDEAAYYQLVWANPAEVEVLDPKTEQPTKVMIDETATLAKAISQFPPVAPYGLRFAGEKYSIVRFQETDVNGTPCKHIIAVKPKGGAQILISPVNNYVVIGLWDEDPGNLEKLSGKQMAAQHQASCLAALIRYVAEMGI